MTPLQRYQSDIEKDRIIPDSAQREVVNHTQALYDELVSAVSGRSIRRLLTRYFRRRAPAVRGLYLWGGVGSGKTYIVDMLFDCLPMDTKLRVHFHRYMQWVHTELKLLADVEAPLRLIANKLARDTRVICFDEFHVADITDAMLLSGLFHELFSRGVTLVATSNEHPDKLYRDGLQRERFLPAIELLKQHTRVLNLDTGTDYRLRYLDQARTYHYPLNSASRAKLAESFAKISMGGAGTNSRIEIAGREIQVQRLGSGVVWFDFHEICGGPRGAADYIEIARQFQTVFIEGITQMDDLDNDRARRFITLVDEFYDRNVRLIASAETAARELYTGTRLVRQYERTASRLIEMQSHDYLGKAHLPI